MEKLLIDALGAGLGIFAALVFYETFMVKKKVKGFYFLCGVLAATAISVASTAYLQNAFILPLLAIAIRFALTFYYSSGITYRALLSLASAAIAFATEMLVAFIHVRTLLVPIELIQASVSAYMFGVLASNLITISIVYVIRVFMKERKHGTEKRFNLLIAAMPIQAIILCYIVSDYLMEAEAQYDSALGIVAVFLSISLIFITMVILDRQQKALLYKKEYEIEQARLNMQIWHYQEIYQEQQNEKRARHEMRNNMIAIAGYLKDGKVQKALDWIDNMDEYATKINGVVDTGLPPIDAILSAKIARAREADIEVEYTSMIDDDLFVNQFDLAVIIANALDNAIEGIERSESVGNVGKVITLSIKSVADYISILVENDAFGAIYEDFQSSKPDNMNHGFGMALMREVAQKYNGSFQPSYDSKLKKFSLKVMLKNQKP